MAAFIRIPMVAEIGDDLSLTAVGVGALSSVFAIGRVVADIPAGRFTERLRPGTNMSIAGVLVLAGSAILAMAQGSLVAFVGAFVSGIGSAWTLTTAMEYFARAPRERRGKSMSYMAGALLTGQAIGPAIGGLVAFAYDWRVALWIAVIGSGLTALSFLKWRGPMVERPQGDVPMLTDDRATRGVLTILYLIPAVQFSTGGAFVQTLVPLTADGPLDIPVNVVGVALGIGGIARFVGAMSAGQISDRIGRRAALLPGLGVQLAGLVVFMVSNTTWAWWTAIMLVSVGSVGVNVGTTMLADLSGGAIGKRLGVFRLTGDSAFVIAPLLAGWLYLNVGRGIAVAPSVLLTGFVFLGALAWLPETR